MPDPSDFFTDLRKTRLESYCAPIPFCVEVITAGGVLHEKFISPIPKFAHIRQSPDGKADDPT
jgi:hypothetical protein